MEFLARHLLFLKNLEVVIYLFKPEPILEDKLAVEELKETLDNQVLKQVPIVELAEMEEMEEMEEVEGLGREETQNIYQTQQQCNLELLGLLERPQPQILPPTLMLELKVQQDKERPEETQSLIQELCLIL